MSELQSKLILDVSDALLQAKRVGDELEKNLKFASANAGKNFASSFGGATTGFSNVKKTAVEARKEIDNTTESVRRLGTQGTQHVNSLQQSMVRLASAGYALRQLYSVFTQAVTGASNLAEAQNALNLTFGKSTGIIREFAKDAADSYGLTVTAATQAATQLGGQFLSVGLTQKKAAEETLVVLKRASDLASFFNTSVADAQFAISAAFRGETEPIRRYNVFLDESAIKLKAVQLGLSDGSGELTRRAKLLSAESLILEKTALVQNDFQNTAEGVANAQRRLQASTENLRTEFGEKLLPTFQSLLSAANSILGVFAAFPAPVRTAVLGIGLLAGAVRALTAVFGNLKLITGLGEGGVFFNLIKGSAMAVNGIGFVTGALRLMLPALAAAALGADFLQKRNQAAADSFRELLDAGKDKEAIEKFVNLQNRVKEGGGSGVVNTATRGASGVLSRAVNIASPFGDINSTYDSNRAALQERVNQIAQLAQEDLPAAVEFAKQVRAAGGDVTALEAAILKQANAQKKANAVNGQAVTELTKLEQVSEDYADNQARSAAIADQQLEIQTKWIPMLTKRVALTKELLSVQKQSLSDQISVEGAEIGLERSQLDRVSKAQQYVESLFGGKTAEQAGIFAIQRTRKLHDEELNLAEARHKVATAGRILEDQDSKLRADREAIFDATQNLVQVEETLGARNDAVTRSVLGIERAQAARRKSDLDLADIAFIRTRAEQQVAANADNLLRAQAALRRSNLDLAQSAKIRIEAEETVQQNADSAVRSQFAAVDAQKRLNELTNGYAASTREARTAVIDLKNAEISRKTSALDVADAQDRVRDAQRALLKGGTIEERVRAVRDLERARLGLQSSKLAREQNAISLEGTREQSTLTTQGTAAALPFADTGSVATLRQFQNAQLEVRSAAIAAARAKRQDELASRILIDADEQKLALQLDNNAAKRGEVDATRQASLAGRIMIDASEEQLDVQRQAVETVLGLNEALRGLVTSQREQGRYGRDVANAQNGLMLANRSYARDVEDGSQVQSQYNEQLRAEKYALDEVRIRKLEDAERLRNENVARSTSGVLLRELNLAGAQEAQQRIEIAQKITDQQVNQALLNDKKLSENEIQVLYMENVKKQAELVAPGSPVRKILDDYTSKITTLDQARVTAFRIDIPTTEEEKLDLYIKKLGQLDVTKKITIESTIEALAGASFKTITEELLKLNEYAIGRETAAGADFNAGIGAKENVTLGNANISGILAGVIPGAVGSAKKLYDIASGQIRNNSMGSIVTSPIITTAGEMFKKEVIIPLEQGAGRAYDLASRSGLLELIGPRVGTMDNSQNNSKSIKVEIQGGNVNTRENAYVLAERIGARI